MTPDSAARREALLEGITLLAARGPVTLPGIAQRYGLPMSRAWALVQTLLRRGDLIRAAPVSVPRGRPRTGFICLAASLSPFEGVTP